MEIYIEHIEHSKLRGQKAVRSKETLLNVPDGSTVSRVSNGVLRVNLEQVSPLRGIHQWNITVDGNILQRDGKGVDPLVVDNAQRGVWRMTINENGKAYCQMSPTEILRLRLGKPITDRALERLADDGGYGGPVYYWEELRTYSEHYPDYPSLSWDGESRMVYLLGEGIPYKYLYEKQRGLRSEWSDPRSCPHAEWELINSMVVLETRDKIKAAISQGRRLHY